MRLPRVMAWLLAVWAAGMYALMFRHLLADFPRAAPWSDMSKCTDEGWYAGGALHHFIFGHWYLPYSFNPTVALPMWPLMLGGWFSVAGVGMLQARIFTVVLYGISLALLLALLRQAGCRWITCVAAVLLMAANPFCYVFDRMALLEPVTVFWWVLGLVLAGWAAQGRIWRAAIVGVAIVALVLTKTTGVTLAVSVLYFLCARRWEARAGWIRHGLLALMTTVALWSAYFFLWVRPRYLYDFRYVFAINDDHAHLMILPRVVWSVLRGGLWINAAVLPLTASVLLLAAVRLRGLWRSPLFGAMVVATASVSGFLVYHGNIQPRYYLLLAIPLVTIAVMGAERMWQAGMRVPAAGAAAVLVVTAIVMTVRTVGYARHPTYAYRDMAMAVAGAMRAGGGDPVLFAGAGDDISLYSGVKAISMYEPYGLQRLLDQYHPGWMGAWLPWESAFPEQVSGRYELQPVESFKVCADQPQHDLFVLYEMTPRGQSKAASGK